MTGPFGEVVADLTHTTDYSFRVCGNDENKPAACAQTRTFSTKDGDTFTGRWGFRSGGGGASRTSSVNIVPPFNYTADLASGPNGERLKGSVIGNGADKGFTCMRIDKNRLGPRATIRTSDGNVFFFSNTYYGKSFNIASSGDCSQPFPSDLGFTNGGSFYVDFQIHDAQ